jgi:hypothetical protein
VPRVQRPLSCHFGLRSTSRTRQGNKLASISKKYPIAHTAWQKVRRARLYGLPNLRGYGCWVMRADNQALPLFLLDVDGVLNPFAASVCPPGYQEHELFAGEEPVRLSAAHGPWLRELTASFELVWATAWQEEANRLLAPLLQLPELPVIAFPPTPFGDLDKLPGVANFAGRRPLAWVDDALSAGAHQWAASRPIPTLLLSADPAEGLTRSLIDDALRWAEGLS